MSGPLPGLRTERFGDGFTPTCLSNGVVGITPGPNPFLPGRALVGGFVYSHPKYGFESLAPASWPLGLDIGWRGASVRRDPAIITTIEQSLDMECGELRTRMDLRLGGDARCRVEVIQLAPRSVPCLVCMEVAFSADAPLELELTTSIDREGAAGALSTGDTVPLTRGWYSEDLIEKCIGLTTDRSRLGIATVVMRAPGVSPSGSGRYGVKVTPGAPTVFRLCAALVSDLYSVDPVLEAVRLARWAEMIGFPAVREENRSAWKEVWKSRIRIEGNPDDQRALDTAFYYYHSSVSSATRAGLAPFGLANHEAYFGHTFWDTDIWMLIPALLGAPDSARRLMEFRLRGLPAAQRRAALFGYRGAQFPWEAGLDGTEVTPSCCPTGWAEQHVTPDVAIGAWEYQRSVGDRESLLGMTWPILKGAAEWIESRGHFTPRGFEIGHMMGPDEGITDIHNQSYFNLASKMALQAAVDCAREAGFAAPPAWSRIIRSIVIPRDAQADVILPFDMSRKVRSFNAGLHTFEEKDPSAGLETYSLGTLHYLFLHGCPVGEKTFHSTYLHEEKIRLARLSAHAANGADSAAGVAGSGDTVGFPTPAYAACAAFFGERAKAAELFRASWQPYWMEPFGMTREVPSHTYGGFVTNHGSLLQAALLGFTGLRIRNGNWAVYPASLPEGWERIEVDRIWIRGKPMTLTARHGRKAVLGNRQE